MSSISESSLSSTLFRASSGNTRTDATSSDMSFTARSSVTMLFRNI